jgi:predicted RNA methylase
METDLEYWKGKRILELGSGTGILGIGAALIGMIS